MILLLSLLLCRPALAGGTSPEPNWSALTAGLAQSSGQTTAPPIQAQPAAPKAVPMPVSDKQDNTGKTEQDIIAEYLCDTCFALSRRKLPKLDLDETVPVKVGSDIDEKSIENDVKDNGAIIKTGQNVRITGIAFDGKLLFVYLNGGGLRSPKFSQREMHVENGNGQGSTINPGGNRPIGGSGVTLVFEFKKFIPAMTPKEFQALLEPFLDFSQFRNTLRHQKIEFVEDQNKDAVKQGEITVGMTMYDVDLAASKTGGLGKPSWRDQDDPVCKNKLDGSEVSCLYPVCKDARTGKDTACDRDSVICVKLPKRVWGYELGAKTKIVTFTPKLDDHGQPIIEYGKFKSWEVTNITVQ